MTQPWEKAALSFGQGRDLLRWAALRRSVRVFASGLCSAAFTPHQTKRYQNVSAQTMCSCSRCQHDSAETFRRLTASRHFKQLLGKMRPKPLRQSCGSRHSHTVALSTSHLANPLWSCGCRLEDQISKKEYCNCRIQKDREYCSFQKN